MSPDDQSSKNEHISKLTRYYKQRKFIDVHDFVPVSQDNLRYSSLTSESP